MYRPADIIEVHPEGDYLKAMKVYDEWMRTGGGSVDKPVPLDVMEKMYKAAGEGKTAFKTVASLFSKGLQIDDATAKKEGITHRIIDEKHSIAMAVQRDAMIDAVINDVAKANNGIIGRSDSGNVTAGIKSDLDQTFYVFDASDPKKLVRLELKDREFIEKFKDTWKKKHPGLSIEALDIASIQGKNRFPDPRIKRMDFLNDFEAHLADAIAVASKAGQTTEALQFWQAALKLYESTWRAPMLADVTYTNAYYNSSSNRVEFTPHTYQRHRTYRQAGALYWQLGDLDYAYAMQQAEARITTEQQRLDNKPQIWPDDLRKLAAWNRSYAGKLDEAVAHCDLYEKEELRRQLAQSQPPTEPKARESIQQDHPYWYLAVKNGAKIENYGPAPSPAQLASAIPKPQTNAETSRASAPGPLTLLGQISDPFKYDQPRVTNNTVREGTAVSGGALPTTGGSPRATPQIAPAPGSTRGCPPASTIRARSASKAARTRWPICPI